MTEKEWFWRMDWCLAEGLAPAKTESWKASKIAYDIVYLNNDNSFKNYVLAFLDCENKYVILNSKMDICEFNTKPFYKTLQNAKKAKIKFEKIFKSKEYIEKLQFWLNKAKKLSVKELNLPHNHYYKECLKKEKDLLLINKNGLLIKEVNIILGDFI